MLQFFLLSTVDLGFIPVTHLVSENARIIQYCELKINTVLVYITHVMYVEQTADYELNSINPELKYTASINIRKSERNADE